MGKLARFRVVFEEGASEFLISQAKRRRRRLLDIAYAIADDPFVDAELVVRDADGREISHVATEGFVISYWVDAPVKRVVIVEIEREV